MARRGRQSNFELLRIVAMLMVVAHHFVRYAEPPLEAYPFDGRWLFFYMLDSGGEVGVDVFLGISLWFLSARDLSMHTVRRHLIKTEAILLSYSIPLYLIFRGDAQRVPTYYALSSLFPLTSSLWWFMTSYAFLLLMLPFLLRGLRALGQRMHAELVYLVIASAFALPMLPFAALPFSGLTAFFCLAIVIAYLRWYPNPLTSRREAGWILLLASFLVNVGLGVMVKLDPSSLTNNDPMRWQWYPGSLTVVGEALGLILLFGRMSVQSRTINFVARSTVGVYLLHEHPLVKGLIWKACPFKAVFESSWWLPRTVAVVVGVFVACAAVDMMRRLVFLGAAHLRNAFQRSPSLGKS